MRATATPRPSPCGRCDACKAFACRNSELHLYEFNAALHAKHDHAVKVAELGRIAPFGNYGIFIDELHGLERNAADALLKVVEEPKPKIECHPMRPNFRRKTETDHR